MKPQLATLHLAAHRRRTTLLFVYVVVIMVAALVFAPIADAGGGVRDF